MMYWAMVSLFAAFQLLVPAVSSAQIGFDAASQATTSAATLSWPHTVGYGPGRLLMVGVSIRGSGSTVSSVTLGGVPLTFLTAQNNHDNAVRVEIWYLKAPAPGTANIMVNLSSATKMVGGAASFRNVDQSNTFGIPVTGFSTGTGTTDPTLTLGSASNELVFDALSIEGDAIPIAAASGQTKRWELNWGNAGGDAGGAASTKPGAASVTMTWNKSTAAKWALAAVPLRPINDPPVATDRALRFDGTDLVVVPPQPNLIMSTTVTMEAWVQFTGTPSGTHMIMNKEGEYELAISATGKVQWGIANTTPGWTWTESSYTLPLDQWVHVAFTYNAGAVRIYANGVLVDSITQTGGIGDVYPAWNEFTIGGRQNATTQRWIGYIDEVRVWNVARTPAQIWAAYNTVLTLPQPNLMGYWRFSEPSGLTTADASANGYTGTLGNGIPADVPVRLIHYTTPEETLLTVGAPGALTAATDLNGDPLTAVLVTPPANAASFTLNPNGSFSYTPSVDFNGVDSFVFMANDGSTNSAPAVVTLVVTPVSDIRGRVFEDLNYGGGAGRDRSTAQANGATGRPNARVELYNSAGNYVSATNTNASGDYNFSGIPAGNYTVRVVNSSVSSGRAGYVPGTHLAVQTFRTNASGGSALSVTDRVGGEVPNKADAGNGSTTLAALTTATTAPQSITALPIGTNDVLNVDFGYSFNVIANTNNAGQGSLRQFITNANGLANTGLTIAGQAAGRDVSIFMISNGTAVPGLNTGMPDQLNAGVATINLASALPIISGSNTSIDGTTQTARVGNTNAGVVGTGGTVGVDAVALPQYPRPEVAINANDNNGLSVDGNASGIVLQGLAIYNAASGITMSGGSGSSNLIRNVLLGTLPDGSDPLGALRNTTYGVVINSPASCTVDQCYVGWNGLSGILGTQPAASVTATANEVFEGGWNSGSHDALDIDGINSTVRYNLARNNITGSGAFSAGGGNGVELGSTGNTGLSNNLVENNTILSNTSCGISVRNGMRGVTVRRNIVSGNRYGVIVVTPSGTLADGNRITENSIYANTLLGIDVATNGGNPDGVSPNDGSTLAALANRGMDYPVITSASHVAGVLSVSGYIGSAPGQSTFSGAIIELFKAEDDGSNNGEIIAGDGLNAPHGEGRSYIGSLVADASGNFSGSITTALVMAGDLITATATDVANNTSEFGANASLNLPPQAICQDLSVPVDANGNATVTAAQVNNGSSDPDGAIVSMTLSQGSFTCANAGANTVTLTVTDDLGATATCTATVTVIITDHDGDGICDGIDLDDDNDGIPDDLECPNLLTHGDFEYFTGLSNGNNIGVNIAPWILGGGQQANIVQVDGAGGFNYGSAGPFEDADPATGAGILQHYLDINAGSNDIYQAFTLSEPMTIVYSGAFSSRDNLNGTGSISILAGAGLAGAVIDGTGTQTINSFGDSEHTPWLMFERTIALAAGTYSYVVAMTDNVNFDEADIRGTCPDTDGDGIADLLDLDSDNDGIYDCVESGVNAPHTNGILNGAVNANGIPVVADTNGDGLINYALKDSDTDSHFDFTELDSDNDGCTDVIEAGYTDANGDGLLGPAPLTVDAFGLVTSGNN